MLKWENAMRIWSVILKHKSICMSMDHTTWEHIICESIVICVCAHICLVSWILTFISVHNIKEITNWINSWVQFNYLTDVSRNSV